MVYGLNCRRLKESIVGHQSVQWKTMEDCSRNICNIGAWYDRAKGYAEQISTPQRHQQSLRSKSQRNQDCATNAEDPTSKKTAQTIKVAAVTNSKTRHPHYKTTRKASTHKNFMTIRQTVICSPQEPYHSQYPHKLDQVTACQWILAPLSTFSEKLGNNLFRKEIKQPSWESNITRSNYTWSYGKHNNK